MSEELFHEYAGIDPKDSIVAAAVVNKETIQKLSQITGGTAVWKKIRGGSMVLDELLLRGHSGKIGDYVIADRYNVYRIFPKAFFETRYKYKGLLRTPSSERR